MTPFDCPAPVSLLLNADKKAMETEALSLLEKFVRPGAEMEIRSK